MIKSPLQVFKAVCFLSFIACTPLHETRETAIQTSQKPLGTNVDYCIFTGDILMENVKIDTINIMTQPSTTKWEKRKSDKNCRSANPDDCMVWCLVEQPPIFERIIVLVDTTQSKNFVIKKIKTYL